jgi:hypothetical protein
MNGFTRICCRATWLVWMVAFGLAAGCGSGAATEEDDHGSHASPAHKPASFADAVTETERRFGELAGPLSAEDRAKRLVELDDILRWLPELAGDTDLKRADWDAAKGLVDQLVALRSAQPREGPFAASVKTQVAPLTKALGELAAKAASSGFSDKTRR